jgi:2-oxo-4-hydroxy-4-carboxy-5-ureidoimidazoline decarboxylase
MPYSLAQLNQLDQAAFTAALGDVFEATPAIAAAAWPQRPFASLRQLHYALVEQVQALSRAEQLALVRAHPDLGSRGQMAAASGQEQAGAGLNQLNAAEYAQFQALNQRYQEKFGFPFVMAIANQNKASILSSFAQRLNHSAEQELAEAIAQIVTIAWFRLQTWIQDTDSGAGRQGSVKDDRVS